MSDCVRIISMEKIQYVVSAREYQYNDEGYDATDGGTPVKVFNNKQLALDYINQRKIADLKAGDMTPYEGHYFEGEDFVNYHDFIGDSYVDSHGSDGDEYCYAYEFPNMSEWSDEKIMQFMEFFNAYPYIITEVKGD